MADQQFGVPTLGQIHAYMLAHGWWRLPDDPPGQEYWKHPTDDYPDGGMTFPSDDAGRDATYLAGMIETFAQIEGTCEHEVLAEILGRPDPATLLKRVEELEGELAAIREIAGIALPVLQEAWKTAIDVAEPAWTALAPLLAPDSPDARCTEPGRPDTTEKTPA